MKNKKSMLWALVVATILCVSVLASSVFAADDFEFTGSTVSEYKGTDSTVTIPSTSGGTTITTIASDAFEGKSQVTVVYLPKTITTVENGAFSGCDPDVRVIFDMNNPDADLPAGMENWGVDNAGGMITYYTTGGNTTYTLADASTISSGNTGGNTATADVAYIKDGTVEDLLRTHSFTTSKEEFETIIYTNTGSADVGAVDVSKSVPGTVMMWEDGLDLYFWFDGEKLVMPADMEYYYLRFEKVREIEGIELLNTSNVTNFARMFSVCSSLEKLDLRTFDTSNVTNMEGMFIHCKSLNSLNVSSFDTSNVTDMGCMFDSCEELTTLDLSNFNTENVKQLMSMFAGCVKLSNLNISSFRTPNVRCVDAMFSGCVSLNPIDISTFDLSLMFHLYETDGNEIEALFANFAYSAWDGLTAIYVKDEITKEYMDNCGYVEPGLATVK